jgi:hypothetical protein
MNSNIHYINKVKAETTNRLVSNLDKLEAKAVIGKKIVLVAELFKWLCNYKG